MVVVGLEAVISVRVVLGGFVEGKVGVACVVGLSMAAVIGGEVADEGGGAVESGGGGGDRDGGAGGGTGWTVDLPRPRFNFQAFTFLSAYSC